MLMQKVKVLLKCIQYSAISAISFAAIESEAILMSQRMSVMSEGCDGGEGGGSGETSRPVPVSEFGTFVSEHHAHGNRMFNGKFEVRK